MSTITYNIEELKEKAQSIAEFNKVDKILATADGQFFLEADINAARFHAKKNGYELHELVYATEAASPVPEKKTFEERIANINLISDIAEIENLVKGEKSKQVLQAASERIEAIKAEDTSDERKNI
jgi:hypothetical protein